jgi:hypothetical protein
LKLTLKTHLVHNLANQIVLLTFDLQDDILDAVMEVCPSCLFHNSLCKKKYDAAGVAIWFREQADDE